MNAALDEHDAYWQSIGYPRTGLYHVVCSVTADFAPIPRQSGPNCFAQIDSFSTGWVSWGDVSGGGVSQVVNSTLSYFVPQPPSGHKVQSAKLRVFAFRQRGTLQGIPLNGKLPVAVEVTSTFCDALGQCTPRGWATWDFTQEAQALAAQGGGELQIRFDPVPPVNGLGNYGLSPIANYPWHHGNENHALTVTFEADCPRELKVAVSPGNVRPVLPINQAVAAGVRNIVTQTTVTATAKQCLAPGQAPSAVDVTFAVRPPAGGSNEVGGHLHSPGRPTGTFGASKSNGGTPTASCRIEAADVDEAGIGMCTLTYHAPDVAGTETIVATAPDFPEATAKVLVALNSFVAMPTDMSRYVLVGAPSSNDPCPNEPDSLHEENHWGRLGTRSAVRIIAEKMRQKTGILLRVNDMSLPSGGLFDIRNGWTLPHKTHRTGRDTDVGFSGVREGACVDFDRELLRAVISSVVGTAPLQEGNHFHINGRSCEVCP